MSRGEQAGALSLLKFTNHSDCSGALRGRREGGSKWGVSFDALNKNIRETNKQGRKGGKNEDEEVVRKHQVTRGILGMVMRRNHFLCMMGKLHERAYA